MQNIPNIKNKASMSNQKSFEVFKYFTKSKLGFSQEIHRSALNLDTGSYSYELKWLNRDKFYRLYVKSS